MVLYHFVYHKVHTTFSIELFWKQTFFRFEMDMEKSAMKKKEKKEKKLIIVGRQKVCTASSSKLPAAKVNILHQNQDLYKHFCYVNWLQEILVYQLLIVYPLPADARALMAWSQASSAPLGDWGPSLGIPWGPPQEVWVHLANPAVPHRLVASWFTQKGRMPTQTWPTPTPPSLQEPEEAP